MSDINKIKNFVTNIHVSFCKLHQLKMKVESALKELWMYSHMITPSRTKFKNSFWKLSLFKNRNVKSCMLDFIIKNSCFWFYRAMISFMQWTISWFGEIILVWYRKLILANCRVRNKVFLRYGNSKTKMYFRGEKFLHDVTY